MLGHKVSFNNFFYHESKRHSFSISSSVDTSHTGLLWHAITFSKINNYWYTYFIGCGYMLPTEVTFIGFSVDWDERSAKLFQHVWLWQFERPFPNQIINMRVTMKFFKRYSACYGCDCSHVGKSTKECYYQVKKKYQEVKKNCYHEISLITCM